MPPGILSSGVYRPHLVAGDPNQRRAVVEGNEIRELYLGVAFLSGPENIELGKSFSAELALIYYPNPIYDALIPDATFTIREGARIMARRLCRALAIMKRCFATTDENVVEVVYALPYHWPSKVETSWCR